MQTPAMRRLRFFDSWPWPTPHDFHLRDGSTIPHAPAPDKAETPREPMQVPHEARASVHVSRPLAEDEVPHAVPELEAAVLELRQGPVFGALGETFRGIRKRRLRAEHFEHLHRVLLPIGRAMDVA